jgi:tryptophan 2,3-dioxygenase
VTLAEDEPLFIITHQTHELWFKQFISELSAIQATLALPLVTDSGLARATQRLARMRGILGVLRESLAVLETMTPMDFLEFRDFLVPASGFQSLQFRQIEKALGMALPPKSLSALDSTDLEILSNTDNQLPSLIDLTEAWLERTPNASFDWQLQYREAVDAMLSSDAELIRRALPADRQKAELENLSNTRANFETLFDSAAHQELVDRGLRRFSQRAIINAVFIFLYRDRPLLQMPYLFLQGILDVEDALTAWRQRHAQMAHRMIGSRIGTGASSGAEYLARTTLPSHRVFSDLRNLSSFLIPKNAIPKLPPDFESILSFSKS